MVNNNKFVLYSQCDTFYKKEVAEGISFQTLLKGVVLLLEVTVHQNQVDKALKALKRQMTKEGLLKELKRRRFYEKPSVKKKRKQKEAKKKRKSAMRRSFS
jgi:small subunit ribosomal protein S21